MYFNTFIIFFRIRLFHPLHAPLRKLYSVFCIHLIILPTSP